MNCIRATVVVIGLASAAHLSPAAAEATKIAALAGDGQGRHTTSVSRNGCEPLVSLVDPGAKALIDTGARRTAGNLPLARALGLGPDDPRRVSWWRDLGPHAGHPAALGALSLGAVRFDRPTVTFTDLRAAGRS